jgi:hypothetical protein
VVFEDVIASCELVNCSGVQVSSHQPAGHWGCHARPLGQLVQGNIVMRLAGCMLKAWQIAGSSSKPINLSSELLLFGPSTWLC